MIINDNKEDLRWKSCHKSINDRGALIMMWGRDEKRQPSVVAHWRIAMASTCYRAMDKHN